MLHQLIVNFAASGLFIGIWAHFGDELARISQVWRDAISGLLVGCAAATTMLLSYRLPNGILIDLRFCLLASVGVLSGPVGSLIAVAIAFATRATIGGPLVVSSLIGISVASVIGLGGHGLCGRRCNLDPISVVAFAAVAAIVPELAAIAVRWNMLDDGLRSAIPMRLGLNFAGTCLTLMMVGMSFRRSRERALLVAAIRQSPDYLYVKDDQARLVAFNHNVREINGAANDSELVGKTDLDLNNSERAAGLYAAERSLLRDGEPITGVVEQLTTPAGEQRWFETSKVPVWDVDRNIIGLVGITRDTTLARRVESEVRAREQQLSTILTEMADGVALFDRDVRLLYCNEQYHQMFPMTRDVRLPGTPLRDILLAAVERGEQVVPPPHTVESWIEAVINGIRTSGTEEVRLSDGRSLIVRNRPIAGDEYVSVASDITEIKDAARQLSEMTKQLKVLAATDGLTGLINRRALDESLASEVARSRRAGTHLSIVLLDVDRFKAFNDQYGHQSGDVCLRRVATAIAGALRRPGDVVGRYGGEEFCAVLPDTDEDGAFKVAEAIRLAVADLGVPHVESRTGMVTISAGVCTAPGGTASVGELLSRADSALYAAKKAGRNRVFGWSERTDAASMGQSA